MLFLMLVCMYVHIPIYFYAKLLKKIELFDVQIYFLYKIL